MKHGTCTHCGYDMELCQCGKKLNMAGNVEKYQNYNNYENPNRNPFAMTSPRMYQRDEESNKFFTEILPINNEEVAIWVQRTQIHTEKLTSYSRNHHIYGTKREWACHSSTRYCFICTLCDFVDILRSMALSYLDLYPKTLYWRVSESQVYRLSPTRE